MRGKEPNNGAEEASHNTASLPKPLTITSQFAHKPQATPEIRALAEQRAKLFANGRRTCTQESRKYWREQARREATDLVDADKAQQTTLTR